MQKINKCKNEIRLINGKISTIQNSECIEVKNEKIMRCFNVNRVLAELAEWIKLILYEVFCILKPFIIIGIIILLVPFIFTSIPFIINNMADAGVNYLIALPITLTGVSVIMIIFFLITVDLLGL